MARERNYDYYRRNYQYQDTALHTNYNYFRGNAFDKNQTRLKQTLRQWSRMGSIQGQIRTLERRERDFYQQFGASTFTEFKFIMQRLFKSADVQEDLQIIQRCRYTSIQDAIHTISMDQNQEEVITTEVDLEINTLPINETLESVTEKINQALINAQKEDLQVTINDNKIHMKVNEHVMKATLKSLKLEIMRNRNYNVASNYSRALADFLRDHQTELEKVFSISVNGQPKDLTIIKDKILFRPMPYGYEEKELKAMFKGTDQQKKEAQVILQKIRDAIRAYFFGSNRPSTKLQTVFNRLLNQAINEQNIMFIGGGGWDTQLKGDVGEFGLALLSDYIRVCFGFEPTAKLLGALTKELSGYQHKIDTAFFGDIGAQVKNYHPEFLKSHGIDVRQQPFEIAEYFDNGQSLIAFIANYYFETFAKNQAGARLQPHFDQLTKILDKDYRGVLLRLAVDDFLEQSAEESDKVTFYFISGEYLVPGSVILEYYARFAREDFTFKIDPPKAKYVDPTDGESTGKNAYWKPDPFTKWKPTGLNQKGFEYYGYKDTTFHAHMDMDIKQIEQYALWL